MLLLFGLIIFETHPWKRSTTLHTTEKLLKTTHYHFIINKHSYFSVNIQNVECLWKHKSFNFNKSNKLKLKKNCRNFYGKPGKHSMLIKKIFHQTLAAQLEYSLPLFIFCTGFQLFLNSVPTEFLYSKKVIGDRFRCKNKLVRGGGNRPSVSNELKRALFTCLFSDVRHSRCHSS